MSSESRAPAPKAARVYTVVKTDEGFEVRVVCGDYIAHLHTVIERHTGGVRTSRELPDCRHALWCDCIHTNAGPARGSAIYVRKTEDAAWDVIRRLQNGDRGDSGDFRS